MKNHADTIGHRIKEMTGLINHMRSTLGGLDTLRTSMLVGIASVCKSEGFNCTVTPVFNHDADIVIRWEKKDKAHPITNFEREELMFRVQQVTAMGFKRAAGDTHDEHVASFNYKVR